MKAIGVLVAAAAFFFLAKDFTRGWVVQSLLITCGVIGLITFVMGWLPRKQADEFQREALSEYMREQLDDKGSNVPG